MKWAVLFPGGGTQYTGMGKKICHEFSIARETFREAGEILGYDLASICFEGDPQQLADMQYSQPAIFVTSVSAFRAYQQELNIQPAFLAGHSLGEYAALTCSGALSFADAIRLVGKRGELLQWTGNRTTGTMMAVNKLDEAAIRAEIQGLGKAVKEVYLAVYNSDRQYVLSGKRAQLEILAPHLQSQGAETNILPINTPSHCPLMKEAAAIFAEELGRTKFAPLQFPVISNVTARPYSNDKEISDTLLAHFGQPVRWQASMEYLAKAGVTSLLEAGPQSVLKNLSSFITPQLEAFSSDQPEDISLLYTALGSRLPDVAAFIAQCQLLAVSTPNHCADLNGNRSRMSAAWNQLRSLDTGFTNTSLANGIPAQQAYDCLREIIMLKQTEAMEWQMLREEIMDKTNMHSRIVI